MKKEIIKEKSVMQQLRDIRDKISGEIKDMSFEELKRYLMKKKTLHPSRNSHAE
jgi:hypothetical protein